MRKSAENRGEVNAVSRLGTGTRVFQFCCLFFCVIAAAADSAADRVEKTFSLTIAQGALPAPQRVLRVLKDEVVRLRVTADAAGEIHVHAYRLVAKVTPGIPVDLSFKARATGQFRIEWHPTGDTVKIGGHHAPPLATLEVRPK